MRLELPVRLDQEFADLMGSNMPQWLLKPVEIYVLDFNEVVTLKQPAYRALLLFSQNVKKAAKKLVSRNVNSVLERQLKSDGISTALNILDPALAACKPDPTKTEGCRFDVALINPFLDATINTLKVQARVPCTALKPQISSVGAKISGPEISIAGVITIATPRHQGSITIAFPEIVFLKICESMFGEPQAAITGEVEDAAGELLNIIYGSAKAVLNNTHGYQLTPVLPTVLSGERLNIRQRKNQNVIVLPFKTEHGPFQIEIAFEAAIAA
jgi:chemotaxis protein CheX